MAIYFVQVERLNNTGRTTINTMMTPISVIPSVDPACEVTVQKLLVWRSDSLLLCYLIRDRERV